MHPDIDALRPKLKEILYDCAVEIHATKAALYLFDGSSRFDLASTFGFKVPIREWTDRNDPIVDRCGRGRNAFYVNGLAEEPRFSESLYECQTDRLLVVPIYMRGQLVGFIDMRDKAGKQPFEQADIPKGQAITARICELFANKNVFGQRFITVVSDQVLPGLLAPVPGSEDLRPLGEGAPLRSPPPVPTPPPAPVRQPVVQPAPPSPPRPPVRPAAGAAVHKPRIAAIIVDAHRALSDILARGPAATLGKQELDAIRPSLRSTLDIPGAVVAMLSAYGTMGGIQEIVARSTLSVDASYFLQSRLNIWLSKRGEIGGATRVSQQALPGSPADPIEVAHMQKVLTAPVSAGTLGNMFLTVAFSGVPDRDIHEMLAENLNQLQSSIDHVLDAASLRGLRISTAERLLEPDFSRYPALRHHTDVVVGLVERFARELELSKGEAEQARLVAIVHDAGMRLLEYETLYRKRDISTDELGLLREHVFVGAALVEPLLGREVAVAVLSHHERVDGRGYPNELAGDAIPFSARLVQICDAYAAMTDPQTYQPPESPAAALDIVARGAGSQFDFDLAARFVDMMRSGR